MNAEVGNNGGGAALTREDVVSVKRAVRDFETLREAYRANTEVLETLKNELEAKNRELDERKRLSAGVAHEIRNPLGGIELYASLIERADACGEKEKTLAGKILAAVSHLNRIVEDMLTYARIPTPQRRSVQLESVVGSALSLIGPKIEAKQVRIETDFSPKRADFPLDPDLMQQVVVNVVQNALEAVGSGGRIVIRSVREAALLTLSFADDGPGISEEIKARLFEPFFTNTGTGTGLGLSMVESIIEAHDGRIDVDNRPEGGACFTITIPEG